MAVIGSLFERRAAGLYHNTAVLIDTDGALRGMYRKMHIPDDPLYYEKFYFTPGDLGFRSFALRGTQVGALVCWDQWFPEAARLTALSGAQILLLPDGDRLAPAREGGVRHGAARRVGDSSSAATPSPTASSSRSPIASASRATWSSGAARSSPTRSAASWRAPATTARRSSSPAAISRLIDETRRNWPFLRDRRIDAYDGLLQRYLDESGSDAAAPFESLRVNGSALMLIR